MNGLARGLPGATGHRTAVAAALDNSVMLRRSGLLFARIPPFRTWELIGQQLIAVADSSTWWIADWLAYGETAFQDRYKEATQKTALNYQTLRNYAWVARRFELSRRRDSLSFGHHAELAALDRPEQDFWLRKAEEFGWSRNQLRKEVRASLRERQADPDSFLPPGIPGSSGCGSDQEAEPFSSEVSKDLSLRITDDQLAQFAAAASTQHLELSEWAIQVMEKAAAGGMGAPGIGWR